MKVTKRDLALISILAIATAIAVYFASGGSIPGAVIGLFIGAVGGLIPSILIRVVRRQ